ncbi:MAG TPA: (2Fe-2S)-binding protein [Terriglobales bacterium]|nr:(2Fe-2S)-binding protein [Terriglobales bacterium]
MKQVIQLNINGEPHEVMAEPHDTLLGVLREDLGLMGTKQGCDTGGCGCCTVLLDGQAVYSCMLFAMAAQGRKITTIEGLKSNGKLDPLQEAFIQTGAVQCGYCTCGMILAAKSFLSESPSPSDEQIRGGIAGNLCRCTGYQKIVDAIRMAATRG